MSQAQLARLVDVFGRCDFLFQQAAGLNEHSMENPVDGKTHDVFYSNRFFTDLTHQVHYRLHRFIGRIEPRNHLDELHDRSRREKMRP